jgi:hypothetical protein
MPPGPSVTPVPQACKDSPGSFAIAGDRQASLANSLLTCPTWLAIVGIPTAPAGIPVTIADAHPARDEDLTAVSHVAPASVKALHAVRKSFERQPGRAVAQWRREIGTGVDDSEAARLERCVTDGP